MKVWTLLRWSVVLVATPISALELLSHRAHYSVPVKSYQEILFGDVFRQQYDFSCGSAALASLLTYHYEIPSDEQTIFKAMFKLGDKKKIEEQGFSLLDMKNYLATVGLRADGFQVGLEKLKKLGVPGITLVNFDGYLHFVVIKGMNSDSVIIGDPSRGTMIVKQEEFARFYQGIVLLIRNEAETGRRHYIADDQFALHLAPPLDIGVSRDSLGIFTTTLPEPGEY